jgi:hypothetical protein
MKMRRWISTTLLTIAALGMSGSARAGLVPVQVSVTPDSGLYRYTYGVVLPTDSILRPGDYFTIYNFDGLVAGTAQSSGADSSPFWTFSTSAVGPTPAGVLPDDNPAIPNITWTYTGAEINIDASIGLGNFWADSLYPTTTQSWFASSTGTVSGVNDSNITPTTVPVPVAPPVGLPEPASFLLAGLGLPLIAAFRARGKRKGPESRG